MRSVLGVLNIFGKLLAWYSVLFLFPILTALFFGELAPLRGFVIGGVIAIAGGLLLHFATQKFRYDLKSRDAYLLVTVTWLTMAAVATIPFVIDTPGLSFTRAYFESMSGLSTTGATTLTGVDRLPHCINLWRHVLSWFGGMGIIVLAVAILPLLGVGGMQLYRAGAPGTVKDAKLAPRITETARTLGYVYLGMTVACMVMLWIAGMDLFDAICHSFSTVSLGGFSTHDANIGYFHSPAIEVVLIVFMLLAAMNFATHFGALRKGHFSVYSRDPEARYMLMVIVSSCVGIAIYVNLNEVHGTFMESLRYSAFSVVSMATTGGFINTDFGNWPVFAPVWLLFLSCFCANTGSTGGGIRMFRSLILAKQSLREMFTLVHPQAVFPLKIAQQVVPNGVVYSVLAFLFLYFTTIAVLTFGLLISGMNFMQAVCAIVACINNVGQGLHAAGGGGSYSAFSDFQLWVCTAAMFLGRIEIMTAAVLFTPTFWRK